MTHVRSSCLTAAAACLLAVTTPAFADDAGATGAAALHAAKTKYHHAKATQAYVASVPDSGCRLENWRTLDGYDQFRTLCGPR